MAASRRSVETGNASLEDDDSFVYVFDRREGNSPEIKIPTGGLFSFTEFKHRVNEALGLTVKDEYVIATTNREEIHDDMSWDMIDKGDTLYVLRDLEQDLCAPAQERVNYLPHYDTIVKGGMYEYYASEGQNPMPYALAELLDNALAATANNIAARNIEIRLHFDDSNPSKNSVYVIDNGKGMTPRHLNNWAIYRLSKFIRRDKRGRVSLNGSEDILERSMLHLDSPRSLNSDISYFGVGGKQAIFFIGNTTRMISRPKGSKDVHELTISKDEFEKKEKNHEAIYSGYIRNRKAGDYTHVSEEDEILRKIISEEIDRESFTVVVIQGINQDHVSYLKQRTRDWTRQLAHIYHFYIHGPNGNMTEETLAATGQRVPTPFKNIDIQVKMFNRGQTLPKIINLRDIDDDMQTAFVRSSAATFDFKAIVENVGVVEGVLRYHPFLYDRETYPMDITDARYEPEPDDDHMYAINDRPARGRRPIFECYWNGRLIPYSLIEYLDWCAVPKKLPKNIRAECYNRISGVLWTNDKFQVSTNKLTFIDLEMRLRDKTTWYSKMVGFTEKRTNIEKEFQNWLRDCHEQFDKQIHFAGNLGAIVRTDLPKHKQTPWVAFKSVEWDRKVYKRGQLVKILRTIPMLLGTIKTIMLYGEHEGDVFATGGELEVIQEPRSLYDEVKIVPLSKLDRSASDQMIKKFIEDEEAKLPDRLHVTWPDGFPVVQNEKRPAGKTIGNIKIEIMNKRGETISKLPGTGAASKKLLVELKVVWHSLSGNETICSHISQHGKNWPYWFRKMENIKNLGNHSLILQAVLNESGANMYAGKELPSEKIKFVVTEAEPEKFTVGLLDGPFRVGLPFQIPLEFLDEFNNPTKPTSKLKPVLQASGLDISYENTLIKGSNLILKGIVARGTIGTTTGKNFNLIVSVPGLETESQTLKIRLLPGHPSSLSVSPKEQIEVENGNPVAFTTQVLDEAGNVTASDNKPLILLCKFVGSSGLPSYSIDCSSSGVGTLTGDRINVKKCVTSQLLTAKIDLQGYKDVKTVERNVLVKPSNRVANIYVWFTDGDEQLTIKKSQTIAGTCGEHVRGLGFSLADEGGREVKITDKLADKIKVNWTPKSAKDLVVKGKLPDIKVPALIQDSKYCQINILEGSGVEFSFVVRPDPGEPSQIKCSCLGSSVIQIGQELASEIQVTISDKYGNPVSDLPGSAIDELQVSGESLVSDNLKISMKQNVMSIKGVKFEGGLIGMNKVQIQWRDFTDYVKVEMAAGPPVKLQLLNWNLDQVTTVYNENKLPAPIVVQLVDDGGNPAKEADIKVQIAKDTKIKMVPAPLPMKTDSQGKADFGNFTVSGARGTYEIQPKALLKTAILSGPKIKINIEPDPSKPVTIIVEHNVISPVAGDKLPIFTVKIMSEDENQCKDAKASHLSMKLWRLEPGSNNSPPARAISFSPEPTKANDGIFKFRDKKVPEQIGKYNVMFVYYDGKHQLFSEVITISVKPGPPFELVSLEPPGTPTVSNTRNTTTRVLIRSLRLELRDQFGNSTGGGYNGKVHLTIMGPKDVNEIPHFIGGTRELVFTMTNSICQIQNLLLQESTPGKDGQEYTLRCELHCDIIPRNKVIDPFDIPFLFFNDAKKQSQMAALSKERDHLQNAIGAYKSLFETSQQLINELKVSVRDAQQDEDRIRDELRKYKIPGNHLQNVNSVDECIKIKVKEQENLMRFTRRHCGLGQAPKDPEVLGKIGHLALVEEVDIARVMSWHMSADMDCVVTLTTKKAKEVYNQTSGRQQVLPLDSIYRKNLPDWSKPLPHIRFRANWRPPGHPVYARALLQFPENEDKCKIVFGMLLGDTLILDTLDHANAYRQEIVKHTHCPTILTREGDRVRSNGKFGGLMNKALPIEKLRGAVFGEPLPQAYGEISTQIDCLQSYKTAMNKHTLAKQELAEQVESLMTPEMQAKFKECNEAENQLKEMEKRLGMTATPKRSSTAALVSMVAESSPNKRSRPSGSAVTLNTSINGSDTPASQSAVSLLANLTPTRQSKRIASMVPAIDDDGRKRLRKT